MPQLDDYEPGRLAAWGVGVGVGLSLVWYLAYTIQASIAASPFLAAEPEAGIIAAPAVIVTDSAASGGTAIQFGSP